MVDDEEIPDGPKGPWEAVGLMLAMLCSGLVCAALFFLTRCSF